jgi:hypothetical protein
MPLFSLTQEEIDRVRPAVKVRGEDGRAGVGIVRRTWATRT